MHVSICYGCEREQPAKPPTGRRLPRRFCDWCRTPKRSRKKTEDDE